MKKIFLIFVLASQPLMSQAQITLTMGGDVNFNKNLMQPHPDGFVAKIDKNNQQVEQIVNWDKYTTGIKHLVNGDLNFANIETVVSDRTDMKPQDKKFVFVTHPQAIQHLIDVGFNFMNIANNHSYDFGDEGITETLFQMSKLQQSNPHVVSFGMGYQNDLLTPKVIEIKGYKIAFAALSIIDKAFKATASKPGLIHIHSQEEYRIMMKNMKTVEAHYKIVSIHYGTEGQVTLDKGQKEYYEYAIRSGDVDLIIGHHPHAVRPIQKINGKYIFYSLGNYLMLGSANITAKENGADFGLFSKLHLVLNDKNRLEPEAIELIPLTDTHGRVRPMPSELSQKRLASFLVLSQSELGIDQANGSLNFAVKNGKGLYCMDNLLTESAKNICK